jgi:hypothetical protein
VKLSDTPSVKNITANLEAKSLNILACAKKQIEYQKLPQNVSPNLFFLADETPPLRFA